ncbi:MAG: P-loop NTPase fold protein [Nonlabens sp.]
MKILSNLPIDDLTPDNDYLGIIEKGDMIVSLLKSDAVDLSEIKMFALYGNWGSGKSTLMKYMQKQFDSSEDKYKTFYFDAWQYENGRDLSYSLLEFIIDEGLDQGEKNCGEILSIAEDLLIGLGKSISLNLPGVRVSGKDLIENVEKEKRQSSFHRKIQDFKKEFRELENKILSTDSDKYNIVFIDDLDRCEPDKVLDLLSEIKLFFNYGERTVFFFGVDEKAVQLAIRHKYGETIKSNEYLEKVFDVKFEIGKSYDYRKLLSYYFLDVLEFDDENFVRDFVIPLFGQLDITNPRKIKKVLNQYGIFLAIQRANTKMQVPNLIGNRNGSRLHSILTLFLIIVRLFFIEKIKEYGDLKSKLAHYYIATDKYMSRHNISEIRHLTESVFKDDYWIKSIYDCFKYCSEKRDWTKFIIMFSPMKPENYHFDNFKHHSSFDTFSSNRNDIYFKFTYYLISIFLPKYTPEPNDDLDFKFMDFKIMMNNIL